MAAPTKAALEARARRAAKRVGLRAEKSRWRRCPGSWDNHGGFQLIEDYTSTVLYGARYELTAEQVLAICAKRRAA